MIRNAGGNGSGGVNEAWRCVGEEMEAAAEAHRIWGMTLSEQLAKPLRVSFSTIIACCWAIVRVDLFDHEKNAAVQRLPNKN